MGDFEINDQFAEEAFTVYDHPKVFVFQKTDEYDPDRVREILGAVDLSKVIRVTPKQADAHPGDLQLPTGRLEEQRSGGTWSDYFNPDGLQNRVQILGVLLWYFGVGLLGLVVYPLVRFAMPGLSDRGYPLSRITGLLLLSALVWLAGSARMPFNRLTIGLALVLILLLSAYLSYLQRDELRKEIKATLEVFPLDRGVVPGVLPGGFVDPVWESRFVASLEGRREADGFLIFQCGVEKHILPPL